MLRETHLYLGKLIHAYPPVTQTTCQNYIISCRCHSMSLGGSETIVPHMPPSLDVSLQSTTHITVRSDNVGLCIQQHVQRGFCCYIYSGSKGGGGDIESESFSFIENLKIHFLFLALKESRVSVLVSQNCLKRVAYCTRVQVS
jgi:hypothetical protein